MHAEAMRFIQMSVPSPWLGGAVLDIGSRNVNGSPREFLALGGTRYVGIDKLPGKGVDVVIDAANYDGGGRFGLVVCAETLEHAPDPQAVFDCAARALIQGGLLVLTCAGPGREPHDHDGYPMAGKTEHYANIAPDDLMNLLEDWEDVKVNYNPATHDCYATAVKA